MICSREEHPSLCSDCRDGNVVTRAEFFDFWLEHFSLEEIVQMGRAIWGEFRDGG